VLAPLHGSRENTHNEFNLSFLSQSSANHSSNKNAKDFSLPEKVEENLEEDTDNESDIKCLTCELGYNPSYYSILFELNSWIIKSISPRNYSISSLILAKFILHQNIRL
jgi:hypothetical protein